MILGALAAKGGQSYLEQQADRNPVAFMALLGKVLPMQLTGGDGGPLVIRAVSFAEQLAEARERRIRLISKADACRA